MSLIIVIESYKKGQIFYQISSYKKGRREYVLIFSVGKSTKHLQNPIVRFD
jgi:hypothetical protein